MATQHVLAVGLGEALARELGDAQVVGPGEFGKGRVHAAAAAGEQARGGQRQADPALLAQLLHRG
ncbi:hypothetical protein D9M70_647380 [compost metagenome]